MSNTRIPHMVSLCEASKVTGISYERLRQMCLSGELPYFASGRKRLINMDYLCDLLNAQTRRDIPEQVG